MEAKTIRQIDVHQVRTHQLVFIIGRCQQYFVAYWLPIDVGPFACLYDSKVFPAHVNPERRQSALHSLGEPSWAARFHVNSTKKGLTICAKWNTAQNPGGAIHAADRCALDGESGTLIADSRRAWTKLSPRAPAGGEVFLLTSPLIERANRKLASPTTPPICILPAAHLS
jgi:hypothetical protein